MNEKKRIACFFTAEYTELNSMKLFLRKINNNVEYIQLCPIGPRKNKAGIKSRDIGSIDINQSGLTGQALINFILCHIETSAFIREKYDAILIEDDKDDRFLTIQPDGTAKIDEGAWEQHRISVISALHTKYPEIPVLFFYAAPEVETWFLADWDNSFGNAYKNILSEPQNSYFSTVFRKYVKDNILTEPYCECLESYGHFDGKYKKISTEIQKALVSKDFLESYGHEPDHKIVHYSKRQHGAVMLENIDPQKILTSCPYFFKAGMHELQAL